MAFDSGWSDGDPGSGRLRFDAPAISRAKYLYINARDAQDAILDEWVPTWRVGDVVVIERPGAERNRVVAWVVGAVYHRGSYWRIPVSIRTVHGAFAAHDELLLHHAPNDIATDVSPATPAAPMAPGFGSAIPRQNPMAPAFTPMAPMAPPAPYVAAPAPEHPLGLDFDRHPPMAPLAPLDGDRISALESENIALQRIIERLVSDDTPLYVAEGTR